MKQILIATNIILLGVAVFFCYKFFDIKNVKSGQKPINETGNSSGLGEPCRNRLCKDYSNEPWEGLIRANLAHRMAERYRGDLGKKVIWFGNNETNIPDATSVWFDLDKLKKFIWEIELKQCSENCRDSLGIRIYYAKYPDTAGMRTNDLAMLNPSYANHHTVFMVPTYWNATLQANVDFDPFGKGCRARFDTSMIAKPGLIFFGFGTGEGTDAENHGSLIPPGIPTGTSF